MKKRILSFILSLTVLLSINGVNFYNAAAAYENTISSFYFNGYFIPAYDGDHYEIVNNNDPNFTSSEKITTSFERYGDLDNLGRCTEAYANVCEESMPTEERGSISSVKPTAWQSVKYDIVSGKYLYNRCHLIGYQLTGENANKRNLITGTRSLNVDAMLPIENAVANYVEDTDNHVLYRVTPYFKGNNLLATGVLIEAESVEDEGINICVFCYNVQDGISLDYSNGDSILTSKLEGSLSAATVTLSTNSYTYSGGYKKPVPTVILDDKTLKNGTDYTVSYSNNKNAGTGKVTINGIGEYSGSTIKTFKINPKSIQGLNFSKINNQTYTGKQIKPTVTVKNGSTKLVNNKDYTLIWGANKSTGKATVTIKGKGNYTSQKTITFYIVPKRVSVSKATPKKRSAYIKWKKATGASGYQITLATNSKFTKGKKTVTVSGSSSKSKTIKSLKSKKTYYVKVRAYKTVNGQKKYGEWSKVKKVKVK